MDFQKLPIDAGIKQNIAACGYVQPTPVQEGAITPILENRDVIGIANTGTGKTAAFLIPLLDRVQKNRETHVLVVVPTRELAAQIQDEMRKLARGMNIYSVVCIGGGQLHRQISDLRRNPQFVLATPGRLKDLIERRAINISLFNVIVLDEVDRMLDMGFVKDITYLIGLLPPERQSLFFSATISPQIQSLIHSFTKNPVMISVKTQDTAENVEQDIIRVAGGQKVSKLIELLRKDEFKKVLVFGRTKHGVEKLSKTLYTSGFRVSSIHGNKPQSKRNMAIRQFKDNAIQVLVATDVASRGIDIADITHVINYDQPATYDDYVHRIGRTGRSTKKGIALTFVE